MNWSVIYNINFRRTQNLLCTNQNEPLFLNANRNTMKVFNIFYSLLSNATFIRKLWRFQRICYFAYWISKYFMNYVVYKRVMHMIWWVEKKKLLNGKFKVIEVVRWFEICGFNNSATYTNFNNNVKWSKWCLQFSMCLWARK